MHLLPIVVAILASKLVLALPLPAEDWETFSLSAQRSTSRWPSELDTPPLRQVGLPRPRANTPNAQRSVNKRRPNTRSQTQLGRPNSQQSTKEKLLNKPRVTEHGRPNSQQSAKEKPLNKPLVTEHKNEGHKENSPAIKEEENEEIALEALRMPIGYWDKY